MKERLYRTAIVRHDLKQSVWDCQPGDCVAVEYACHAPPSPGAKLMAVYRIKKSIDETWRGHVFAQALEQFVL